MQTVLVTGGAGYIGSNCVIKLLESGRNVVIFDNLVVGHQEAVDILSKLDTPGSVVEFRTGDLTSSNDIMELFDDHPQIESVVHFAAFSQVAESVRDPGKYYRNNVSGTINLLDAMRSHGVDKIVFSSTAATYGEPEYTPIDESHPQIPINPYGMSKLMVERIMDDYSASYGLRSVRLRYFNVAGADSMNRAGEWHEPETHLIPNIIRSVFEDGHEFNLYGDDYPTRDGTCIRDYVNVEDLADAHVLALDYLDNGGHTDFFNLGTNNGSTVKEVFSICEKVVGRRIPLEIKGRRPGDPAILVADSKKAETVLGWKPTRTLEDSITTAFEWEKHRRGSI